MLGSEIDISNLKLFKNEICPLRNHLSFFSFRQNSKPFVFLLFRQTTINLFSIRQNKAMRNSQQRTTQSRKLWSSTVLHISSPLSSAVRVCSTEPVSRPLAREISPPTPSALLLFFRPTRASWHFGRLASSRHRRKLLNHAGPQRFERLHWRCVFAPATTRVITKQGRTTSPFCLNVTFDNGRARAPPSGPFPLAFPAHCPHGGRAKRWPLTMSSFQLERDLSIR